MNKQEAIRILDTNIAKAEKHITGETSENDRRFVEAMKLARHCTMVIGAAEVLMGVS